MDIEKAEKTMRRPIILGVLGYSGIVGEGIRV